MNSNRNIFIIDGYIVFLNLIFHRDSDLSTNRGNHLLLHLLKSRYPHIFKAEQIDHLTEILAEPLDKGLYFMLIFVYHLTMFIEFFFFLFSINSKNVFIQWRAHTLSAYFVCVGKIESISSGNRCRLFRRSMQTNGRIFASKAFNWLQINTLHSITYGTFSHSMEC